MKTGEAGFHFPVLGFTPDREIWGFADLDTLTSCGPRTLKQNLQAGMELVDVDGRRWVVGSVRRTGRARPFLPWLFRSLLTGTPQSRIEHELEEMPPLALDEVKARVLVSMETFSQDYHGGDEREYEDALQEVRTVRSIAEIHARRGLDNFMAY